jgi:hypothetical protein
MESSQSKKSVEIKNELLPLLKKHNFHYVTEFSDLYKLLDFRVLIDGSPKILTEKKSLIVFEQSYFNHTYIIDLINDFLDTNKGEYSHIKLYYIDKLQVIKKLFHKREFDSNTRPIGIITINPETESVNIYEEVLVPLIAKDIKMIFEMFK